MTTNGKKKPFGPLYEQEMRKLSHGEKLTLAQRSILMAFVHFRNYTTGVSRPSNPVVAEHVGCHPKTVERALVVLKEKGLLIPIAYLTGGRGRAVEYRFPLPAWAGHEFKSEEQNHRHSVPKPPTFCPKTTDIVSAPTKETKKTEDAARAGRPQNGDKALRADMSEKEMLRVVMLSSFKPLGTTFHAASVEAKRICREMGKGFEVVTIWGEPVPVVRAENREIANDQQREAG
jgi:hypothetical protein